VQLGKCREKEEEDACAKGVAGEVKSVRTPAQRGAPAEVPTVPSPHCPLGPSQNRCQVHIALFMKGRPSQAAEMEI
jgi:hypothetical protein